MGLMHQKSPESSSQLLQVKLTSSEKKRQPASETKGEAPLPPLVQQKRSVD
jgi:hypothetical protein